MKNMSNKVSYFAISLIMGAIIVSFVLTGFQGFSNSAGQVASVDGTPVTLREYNQALQFQMNRWTQQLKVKSLTNQQIKQFRLRESTLENLIMQKHLLNFANDLNFDAGKLAIKDEIKEYKVFQTGNKFDVTKYKALLKQNRLSPTKFEQDIIQQIKSKKMGAILGTVQDSKTSAQGLLRLRNLKMQSYVVSFEKEAMTAFLTVPKSEVKAFAADAKNEGLLKGLYSTYESEQKMGKGKIKKFAQMKNSLAEKHLQKTKRKELTAFNEKLAGDLEKALAAKNIKKIKSLKKKYNITFEEKYEFTPFNLRYRTAELNEDELVKMFQNKDTNNVIKSDTATSVTLARAIKFDSKAVTPEEIKKEIAFSGQRNSRLIENSVLEFKQKNAKVVRSANLFN